MMTPQQIKGKIKNMAAEYMIPAQSILQYYMLERLLERIAHSRYQKNFILKGGFLISAMTRIATRTTMDLDATVHALPLSTDAISEIFQEIISIEVYDQIVFTLDSAETIHEHDTYEGIRLKFSALRPPLKVPVKMDLTTGDIIFPSACKLEIKPMFSTEPVCVMAYNLETILSEKLETILSRGIMNTRPRDFYDIWLLNKYFQNKINYTILTTALKKTMEHRGTTSLLPQAKQILQNIANSEIMNQYWLNYQQSVNYARICTYQETIDTINRFFDKIFIIS